MNRISITQLMQCYNCEKAEHFIYEHLIESKLAKKSFVGYKFA